MHFPTLRVSIAALCLSTAVAAIAADAAKPWLTPLDPSVKKLPMDSQPVAPEASRKMIHVPEGFEVELVAAEPMTMDPVAINWGPDGKIWIVEMADYPLGIDGHGKPGSRVRWLADTDGDGKIDKSVVFAEGLNFANSIMPWRNGVIVTCAPEIIYLEDTDGDGKADVKKVLYSGFDEGNPQLRINGLRPGLDNWLYCANGLQSKGEVRSTTSTDKIASLSGRDFRIRPDTGSIDAQCGATEFTRAMDNDGNWFGNDNSNPLWHYVIADQYLRRNPHVGSLTDTKVQIVTERNPPVYPVSLLQQRFNVDYMANRITSACGIEVYRDQLLFPAEPAQAFACEPVHNLIMRTVFKPEGVSFTGGRAPGEERKEFLASEDRWFRPVMIRTGPDGALWVCDFYRYTVEHPQYMTEEWRSKLELRAGEDRGRIYRIVPKGKKLAMPGRLDKLSTPELVAQLESPNGWTREFVQQMLIWKADKSAVAPLENLLNSSKLPHARLHALCTLDGLSALTDDLLIAAMSDSYPAIRANAIRIAESHGNNPAVLAAAAKHTDDADAKVRLQLACSLGEWSAPVAGEALGRMAVKENEDPFIIAGVMSSALKHNDAVVAAVLKTGKASGQMVRDLLDMSAALNNRATTAQLLDRVLTPASAGVEGWQLEAFAGWLDALPKQKTTLAKLAAGDDELSKQLARAPQLFAAARKIAVDAQRSAPDRIAAVRLLTREPQHMDEDVKIAASLFTPQTPVGVQLASVTAIARHSKANLPDVLLAGWDSYGPDVRLAVTEVLLRREDTMRELLQRAADKKLLGFDVEYTRRARLLKHKNPEIAALAKRALGNTNENRDKVVAEYRADLTSLKGDSARGAAVFAKVCYVCHRIGDVGKDIGPDLRSVTDRSTEGLLVAILDPNHDVDPKYYAYLATLNTGETLMGIVTNETGNAVTILGMDGNPRTVLRKDLASLKNTGRSLMIEGLEAAVNKQDMADLIKYLGYPD